MSLVHHETGELVEIPAGARPLGIKVRPVLRLALGYRDENRNGAPVKSDHFIPRAESDAVVDRFVEKYGQEPKSVRILLPADLNDALDIRYVAFKGASGGEGGQLVAIGHTNFALVPYMGGADTITRWNQDGTVDELAISGPDDPDLGDLGLELRTRFRFNIPDVLGFGSFAEIQTGGAESTDNLWLKVRELYSIFGSRVTVAVEPLVVLKPSTMRAPKMEGRGKNAKQVGWQKTNLWVVDIVVPESIEEMITRLRERQAVLAPNGAVAAIYGTSAPPAPALGPGPTAGTPLPSAGSPEPQPGDRSQDGGPEHDEAGPAASQSDEPALTGEVVDEVDGSVVIPPGFEASGETLDDVLAAPAGADWLQWAAKNLEKFPEEFRGPLEAFVAARITNGGEA